MHKSSIAAYFLVTTLVLLLSGCDRNSGKAADTSGGAPSAAIAAGESVIKEGGPARLVSAETIQSADERPGEWLSHGRTYSEQRYSPLEAVSAETVPGLGLAFAYDFGTSRGIEATPIVFDGIIYVTSTWNIVHAVDAKSGEEVWRFDPEVDKSRAAIMCCDVVNRGVAIWGDQIFTGTIDGRLVALDAKTGEKNWDVNTVDLSKPYSITGAPRVVKGKVIIGNGGAEFGVRGYVSAYDAATGDLVWRFHTVPGNPTDGYESASMEMAAKTWSGDWWEAGGGGTVWDSMAYDPSLDLLYIGVGNGSPWNHEIRSAGEGDNLFLSSIVALRPDSGEYVWHYQTTPAETWDFTATQHMILADLEIEGSTRKVIMQAPKNGFFYVLDRASGEFISANNFVPVNWATHIDQETGRPVENPDARWAGKSMFMQVPGPLGAHNWHPMSYSPDTGLVYIPAQEAPFAYMDNQDGYKYQPQFWNTGADLIGGGFPSETAAFKGLRAMLKGRLLAWDPIAQKERWSVEHGGPWNGGVLSTAGGLVFQGKADAHFAAYDANDGRELWSFFTQTGVVAAPISYAIDGEQYIAVATGWGGSYALGYGGVVPVGSEAKVGRLLVFKLGGEASLPDVATQVVNAIEPPEPFGSEEQITAGAHAYANRCVVCHGDQAMSSGLVPNLRHSPLLASQEAWRAVLIEGALASQGMPNFAGAFDAETAEAIRAYVVAEANSDRDAAFYEAAGQ